jgi:tRNA G18 (ribose-2'-O)-methylase SpoU
MVIYLGQTFTPPSLLPAHSVVLPEAQHEGNLYMRARVANVATQHRIHLSTTEAPLSSTAGRVGRGQHALLPAIMNAQSR